MKIAAIDIGSNSMKLLVAEPGPGGTLVPVRREKEVVRLGHETLLTGHLSSEAIVRAIRTLSMFKVTSENCGAEQVIATATASVREADNAEQFIKEVFARTGIRIEVLSGVEEARLIGIAAYAGCGARSKSLLNIDIGGGSTELSLIKSGKAKALHSMKIGAVRLTEQFISNNPPKLKELTALEREIEAALDRPTREMRGAKWERVTGTSGTILAIGAALQSVAYPDAESTQEKVQADLPITREALRRFNQHMASLTTAERKKLPGISEQRAEIIVAGGQILEQTMKALKIKGLSTCTWSLREGLILDRWLEMEGYRLSSDLDLRLAGAEALGQRFGYEATHGKHVAMLARKLFDQLQELHGLSEHERTLLMAAAMLHDLGYAVSHEAHHKHSLYLIQHSELTGFTDHERAIIANVARYHRKAMPKVSHPSYNALPVEDQQIVWKLGSIVRVADALDRSHQSRVRNVKCRVTKTVVSIGISGRKCEHELWSLESKKDMFEKTFSRTLEIVRD